MSSGSLGRNLRSAAVGLVSGAILASNFAGVSRADQTVGPGASPNLFASEKTRGALGNALSTLLPEWASDGPNTTKPIHVIVIMPHDLRNDGPEQIWDLMPPEVRAKAESLGPGFREAFKRRVIIGMLRGMPLATPLPDRAGDSAGYCIINLPNITDRAASHAQIFALDKDHRMQTATGTARQWWTMEASHEVEHCDDPVTPATMQHGELALELDADKQGMDNIFRHWAQLFPYDTAADSENFLRAFMGARATALFRSTDHAHSTFAGLALPGKSYAQGEARPFQEKDVQKIKDSILAMEQKVIARYDRMIPSHMPAGIRLAHAKEALTDYTVLYRVIKTLYDERAFDDDPLQKHMAQGYLEWTAHYFPEIVTSAAAGDQTSFDMAAPRLP